MLEDVKTVALTAAGHLVAPAAGSKMETKTQTVRMTRRPRTCQGLSTISSTDSVAPTWQMGGKNAAGTAKTSEAKASWVAGI